LKFSNQSSIKIFQVKSAEKFSIKVWLQKVKLICKSSFCMYTTEPVSHRLDFNQGSLEIF